MRASVLAVSGDLAEEAAARPAGIVLSMVTRTSRREAVHDERLGVALRERWIGVGEAVAGGRVTWEQADVLVRCLDELPGDLDGELRTKGGGAPGG